MRFAIKISLVVLSFLIASKSYSQQAPTPTEKQEVTKAVDKKESGTKPTAKNQDGPKPQSPEEVARQLLASGEANKKQGKFDAAINDFDAALEKYNELYEVYVARASCYFLKLDFNSATADYDRAVEIVETEMEKLKTQAKIKHVFQDAAGEKKELDKVDKLRPILAEAYFQRGNLKQFTDDLSGCCEDILKSKELGHLQADIKIAELCKE